MAGAQFTSRTGGFCQSNIFPVADAVIFLPVGIVVAGNYFLFPLGTEVF